MLEVETDTVTEYDMLAGAAPGTLTSMFAADQDSDHLSTDASSNED